MQFPRLEIVSTNFTICSEIKLDVCHKKNFIVVNHGVPIDPDNNIITEPKNVIEHQKIGQRPGEFV